MFVILSVVMRKAYTMELEAEVAKLKEENQELQQKQVRTLFSITNCCTFMNIHNYLLFLSTLFWLLQKEMMKMQKNQVLSPSLSVYISVI